MMGEGCDDYDNLSGTRFLTSLSSFILMISIILAVPVRRETPSIPSFSRLLDNLYMFLAITLFEKLSSQKVAKCDDNSVAVPTKFSLSLINF